MIDSEEYREGTYEKLDNRAPLGVAKEAMTEYLWYNGSTSFVDGEELKRKRENPVKARLKKVQNRGRASHTKDTKRGELFMTRLK